MTYPPAHRTLSVTLLPFLALIALGLSLGGSATAQTFGVAFSYAPATAAQPGALLEPEVQLRDLGLGGTTLDVRLAKDFSGPLEAGVSGRFRSSFGPLGTVAASAQVDLATDGGFDAGVSGSGALASTGLDAALSVFNRNPGSFAAPAAYGASRPFFAPTALAGGVGAHLEVGATQRLGRRLILELTPALSYLSETGLGAGLEGRLQYRRLLDSDNGALLVAANSGPGTDRSFVAGGAEYQLNRRGLPSLSAGVLLGAGDAGVVPGIRIAASGEVGRFSYRAELAAEGYRRDVPPYRTAVALGTELGPGALGLELGAALANPYGVPPLLLRTTYAFRF